MGMIASIYTSIDGKLDPLSRLPSGTKRVCIINVAGPFHPSEEYPAVLLVPGVLGGARCDVVIPGTSQVETGTMFGGSYIACSDSRFGEAVGHLTGQPGYLTGPVALHDRREW